MNKEWSELNKTMQGQIKKKDTYKNGIDTLLILRNQLMQTLLSFKEELCREDFNAIPFIMLMCGKVTHKNLIDNRPLFRYYSSIWIEKTSLIQYNKVSGRYLYEGKNTNH